MSDVPCKEDVSSEESCKPFGICFVFGLCRKDAAFLNVSSCNIVVMLFIVILNYSELTTSVVCANCD